MWHGSWGGISSYQKESHPGLLQSGRATSKKALEEFPNSEVGLPVFEFQPRLRITD